MSEKIGDVTEILNSLLEDGTVPKSVKIKIKKAIDSLSDNGKTEEVKIDTALQNLDEVVEDPNTPTYTRSQIWNVVSFLESAS